MKMKKDIKKIIRFTLGFIPLLLAVSLICIGCCINSDGAAWQKILYAALVSLGVLMLGACLLLKLQYFFQKTVIRVLFFCVIFCMGAVCYHFDRTNDGNGNIIVSACASLAEFFPSRGGYEPGQNEWMIVFYVASYFFAISLLIGIFGRKLTNKWELFLTEFSCSRRWIFWCNIPGEKERLLADHILAKHPNIRCIFSAEEFSIDNPPELIENLNFNGHLLCLRKPGQIHRATCKAPVHFFLTDNCDWNIRMAQSLWDKLKKYHFPKVDFYIRISDGAKGYWVEEWAKFVQKSNSSLEIHLIRESSLIAREIVKKYPLLNSPGIKILPEAGKVQGCFNVLLLGFAEQGEAILREVVCDGQFLHTDNGKDHFKVDIVDRNPEYFSCFEARCREAKERYGLSFIQKDVHSGDFYRFLEENLASYNRIIIGFYDDALNMEIAAKIVEISRRQGVRLDYRNANRHFLLVRLSGFVPEQAINTIFSGLDFFGSQTEIYSPQVIIDEKLDKMAKTVNLYYLKKQEKKRLLDQLELLREKQSHSALDKHEQQEMQEISKQLDFLENASEKDVLKLLDNWHTLSSFTRDSNNSMVISMRNLCLLMGIDPKNFDRKVFDAFAERLRDVYAETEHLRWNAFHFMRGIRTWAREDIPAGAVKPNDIENRMRHAALVDFAELPEVDKHFPGRRPLQDNDYDIIDLLKEGINKK